MNKQLHWKLGDIEITAIQELTDAGALIQSIIAEATPQAIQELPWLAPHFADEEGVLKAVVQSFLVKTPSVTVLIDTCNGNGKDRRDMPVWGKLKTDFLDRLEQAGAKPEDIDFVVNTHLHFDHIGWNTKLEDDRWIPTFPNAKYLFVKEEYNYWTKNPEGEIEDDLRGIEDSVLPIVEAGVSQLVSSDYEIEKGIKLSPSPGHTPGHVCVEIQVEEEKMLIAGDLIYHPCQIANTDWIAESDNDKQLTVETRERVLTDIADTNTLLLGAHVSSPVAGRVKIEGKSFTFSLDSYQTLLGKD